MGFLALLELLLTYFTSTSAAGNATATTSAGKGTAMTTSAAGNYCYYCS